MLNDCKFKLQFISAKYHSFKHYCYGWDFICLKVLKCVIVHYTLTLHQLIPLIEHRKTVMIILTIYLLKSELYMIITIKKAIGKFLQPFRSEIITFTCIHLVANRNITIALWKTWAEYVSTMVIFCFTTFALWKAKPNTLIASEHLSYISFYNFCTLNAKPK